MTKAIFILIGLLTLNTSVLAQSIMVNIQGARYFSQPEYDKLMSAQKLIEKVINGAEFKNRILSFSYNGALGFVQNNGLTNQQIYDLMMTGAEKYPVQTPEDHLMDFDLELYTSSWFGRGTLGYTDITTKTIHMNTRFYDSATPSDIAMNLTHEWMHKMGFDHDQNRTARRDYSVPYAVGYIMRDLTAASNQPTSN